MSKPIMPSEIEERQIRRAKRKREEIESCSKNKVAEALLRYAGYFGRPSEQMWADRDRRLNAPRTISMELLGDPIFEQSALGRLKVSA